MLITMSVKVPTGTYVKIVEQASKESLFIKNIIISKVNDVIQLSDKNLLDNQTIPSIQGLKGDKTVFTLQLDFNKEGLNFATRINELASLYKTTVSKLIALILVKLFTPEILQYA